MSNHGTVRLGDVATYINGYAFKPSDWSDNGLPIIRIQNLTGNDYQTNYYNKEYNPKYLVKKGDVLISWSASLGVFVWKKEDALLNQHIFKVVFDKIDVDKDYFCLAVEYLLKRMGSEVHGSTMKHITKPRFDNTLFPLPDKNTQKQISKKINTTDKLINKYKLITQKLDELIKSRFVEMFGDPEVNSLNWNNMNLANCIVKSNNGMARRGNDANGNIVLRLVELQTGYIDYSSVNRIQLSNDEKQKYLLNDNDFLFARVNGNPEYVGRCATFRKINEPVYHNDHIIRVRFNEKLLSCTFLSVLLNSDYGKRQMKSKIKTSAGQYTISQDGIAAIRIPIPPLRLQTTFADFVAKVENQKATVQQSIDKLETLKKSLMQQYFG